jgi:hypothetical protein
MELIDLKEKKAKIRDNLKLINRQLEGIYKEIRGLNIKTAMHLTDAQGSLRLAQNTLTGEDNAKGKIIINTNRTRLSIGRVF